ncbi:head morphogenesis protein /portal protein [Winogradskyella phage Peternella_1]|uniref:Head morphogenesis protein /portal protein n=1 Tax=Winogradskyella phage Peternella_1 TaxID=2745699 RepID=A0A8E5EBN5_9CAUD|nr:head morphogenesis protein /portal protein [Winogradskyella phage Peternella_1]QQV91569.1 head morphogenesis protein /portal protein [Winogradskyella phage Peternella_1]
MAKELHSGKLKPSDLDQELLSTTYKELNKGVSEGYGTRFNNLDATNTKTVQQLKQNIYRFSAAKTYQELQKFNTYLTDKDGKERSFNDFKKLVLEKHPTYNVNYLQAEYQTAKASAQMAAKWQQFQRNKSRYPNLRYKTVGDEHVRDEHRTLDGFTAAIDDPIWDKIYPPNDWRCRCYVQQTNSTVSKVTPKLDFMKPDFSLNVGKTGVVFNDKTHPYYIIPKRDEKSVQTAFESFKLQAKYGKAKYVSNSGGKVFVSDFAEAETLYSNYTVAKTLADKGMTLKIQPKIDATILPKDTKSTYLIGKKSAERVTRFKLDFIETFTTAEKQGVSVVIIDLIDNKTKITKVVTEVNKALEDKKAYPSITEVIVISKDRSKVERIKRNVKV